MPIIDPIFGTLATIGNFVLNLLGRFTGQASYPMPRIRLGLDNYVDANTGQNLLYLVIENLHKDLHILDLHLAIYVENPFRGWRFWKKWMLYAHDTGPDVAPGEKTDRVRLAKQGSIENFVDKTFGGQIIKEIPKNSVNCFCYAVVKDTRLELKVVLSSKSSILGSRKRDYAVQYTIAPIDGAPQRWVTNWDIQKNP